MHIALCDSNIADRKQMERLLMRESDKRLTTTGVFYIDTFGSREALLNNPMVYDVYFLDVTETSYTAYDLAKSIRDKGILSPIVFCISTLDYRTFAPLENTLFLNKPIKVAELSDTLDHVLVKKQECHVPRIEFRNTTETFYLTEEEILYCEGNDRNLTIHLTDGTCKYATSFIDNVWMDLAPYPSFFFANKTTIVNARYVTKVSNLHVILSNQETIRIPIGNKKDIQQLCDQFSQ